MNSISANQNTVARAVLHALAARVGDDCFARWFGAKVVLSWNAGELTVRSLSRFASDMIRRRFHSDLLIVGQQVTGDLPRLVFTSPPKKTPQTTEEIVDAIVATDPATHVKCADFTASANSVERVLHPAESAIPASANRADFTEEIHAVNVADLIDSNDSAEKISVSGRSPSEALAAGLDTTAERRALDEAAVMVGEIAPDEMSRCGRRISRKKEAVVRKQSVQIKRVSPKKTVSERATAHSHPNDSPSKKRIKSSKRRKPVISEKPVIQVEAVVVDEARSNDSRDAVAKKAAASKRTTVSKKTTRKAVKKSVRTTKASVTKTAKKAVRKVITPLFRSQTVSELPKANESGVICTRPSISMEAASPMETAGKYSVEREVSDSVTVESKPVAEDNRAKLPRRKSHSRTVSKSRPLFTEMSDAPKISNHMENSNKINGQPTKPVLLHLATKSEHSQPQPADRMPLSARTVSPTEGTVSPTEETTAVVSSSTLSISSARNVSTSSVSESSSAVEEALSGNSYTLSTFQWSDHNGIARETSRTIIEYPGQYSPCLFYGTTGVGKTHLVRALLNEHKRRHPRGTSIYMTSEQFTSDYVAAASGGGFPSFRRRYRSCDLFVLEDLQFFLDGKTSTQVELYHTVDTLLQSQKQVLFTADRPIPEMQQLDSRLLARIQGGMVCLLSMPGYATRLEILRQRNRQQAGRRGGGTLWADSVLQRIAARVTTQVRELFGALNRLEAFQRVSGRPLTDHEIDEALDELVQENSRAIRLADVAHAVCATFGLEDSGLQSDSRVKRFSEPRMLAMWLARKYTRAALTEIGAFFGGRKHSTVISAQKRVENWIEDGQTLSFSDTPLRVEEAIRRVEECLRAS
ncbi:MAG: DnaA/Hda family protein [Thermoguttaceae bacterium]|nr:DnaA/Hda family protein [Thermoguttaceae bacterium]